MSTENNTGCSANEYQIFPCRESANITITIPKGLILPLQWPKSQYYHYHSVNITIAINKVLILPLPKG